MFRRTERLRTHPPSQSRNRSTSLGWWAIPAAMVLSLVIVSPVGGSDAAVPGNRVSGAVRPPVQIEKSSNGLVSSTNWAGYAVTMANPGTPFTSVSGSWVVPAAIDCPKSQEESSFWVGIDGFQKTATTVEQIGTDSDCDKGTKKKPGGPTYYAWWELYPQTTMTIPAAKLPVAPGDTMQASVTGSGSSFTLTIQNLTLGGPAFAVTASAPSAAANSSAEWIVEAPSVCSGGSCATSKLADFSIVSFTGATANGAPINSPLFNDNEIDMLKGKKTVKAATSTLSGGDTFNVTWHHI
jgi:peptidase A4-like protein